jgi:uncharacterized protein (TIGR03437 family)
MLIMLNSARWQFFIALMAALPSKLFAYGPPLTILDAANGSASVASGSIAAAYGSNLATSTLYAPTPNWPISLGGTTVTINDSGGTARSAAIFFVSATQVNFQIPPQTSVGAATATITSASGVVSQGTVQITIVAPGIFTANGNGQGAAAAVVIQIAANGTQYASLSFYCGTAALSCVPTPFPVSAVSGNTILVLFGTGISGRSSSSDVSCTIGGVAARVLYAGSQNTYPGFDQVNVVVPPAATNQGTMNVVLTVDGQTANSVLVASTQTVPSTYYVSPDGNDSWSGTLPAPNASSSDGPFASLARGQSAIRSAVAAASGRPLTVLLRGGTYYLPATPINSGTLNFTSADSGTANALITWQNYPGETPVVSGGIALTAWTNVLGKLWQTQLPAGTQPFEYLFYNGQRRLRSRVAGSGGVGYYISNGVCYSTVTGQSIDLSNCNLGTYLRVASEISPTGANAGCPSVTNSDGTRSKCIDRFTYAADDPIAQWINLNPAGSQCGGSANRYPVGDIEITLFDAWTVDVMRVSCVDTVNHIIYFTGPASSNSSEYNFFGPTAGHRYVVENTRDAFNAEEAAGQTGIWFVDRSTSPWILNYLAGSGENLNTDSVVIGQLTPASSSGGSLISASSLSYVTFQGITFEVDNFIPPASGFNRDENGESTLPAAIDCESCQQVTFDSVVVRHTSASGIQIASLAGNSGAPAANDVIQNSAFYDIGSSGVHIGHHPVNTDRAANVVQFVTIQNNIVQGYSRVFADGEGFAQGNGHDVTYLHNDVTDGYHAGISVCLLGCPSVNYAGNGVNIVSQYNHIWNVMQGVTSDGGTLYYNIGGSGGSGSGGKILNNLLHDITDSSVIDTNVAGSGYGGHGIYLDLQTAGVDIENNVVSRVAGSTVFIHEGPAPGQIANTFRNNIFAYGRLSMFNEQTPWPQGCSLAAVPQVNLTDNIFYFDNSGSPDFYVTAGCADSCGLPYNQFQNFQGNLYWRTDGKFSNYGRAFHVLTKPPSGSAASSCGDPANPVSVWTFLTFSQWQTGSGQLAMNEDSGGTASVNPGFGSAGTPADFQLNASPIPGFNPALTNDTILHAGRNNPMIVPPVVLPTFPTYSFTKF